MLCSIIVLTYNSKLEKIYRTLSSILNQNNFEQIEVIIADDGSKNNFFDEIASFFEAHKVSRYKLIANEKNKGTVENLYAGVKVANGQYIKALGSGDLLYERDTINKVCKFMEIKNEKIMFGLMRAFKITNDNLSYWDCAIPMDIKAFREQDIKAINRNIVSWGKLISGASMFFERDTLIKFLNEIREKVIFCEDFIQILALVEHVNIGLLEEYVVWYEMGEGISTSKNHVWTERIKKDYDSLFKYLEYEYKDNKYVLRRIKKQHLGGFPKLIRGILKFFLDPGMFVVPVKTRFQKEKGFYKGKIEQGFLNDNTNIFNM